MSSYIIVFENQIKKKKHSGCIWMEGIGRDFKTKITNPPNLFASACC